MLNDQIQLFTSAQNISSEVFYNATQSLQEFVLIPEIVRTFSRVAENLGDNLVIVGNSKVQPQLRKASHQLFQHFIRSNNTFDPVFTAMMARGIVHPNWMVRQKNVNSLQSLMLSETKYLNWNSHLLKPLIELLLNKLQDPSHIVGKATEQTLLTLLQLPPYKKLHTSLQPQAQLQVQEFTDQMKAANQLPIEFQLEDVKEIPWEMQNNSHKNKNTVSLPFENLDDLNDTQWQVREEAVQGILQTLSQQTLNQTQVELLWDNVIPLIHDHNFKIVITTLDIFAKCLPIIQRPNGHMKELQTRLADPKQVIRQVVRQILIAYLTRIPDQDLLSSLLVDLKNRTSNQKEETLDLLSDLISRNRMLLSSNLELALREIAPLVDDPKPKVKCKALDLLVGVSQIHQDHAKKQLTYHLTKIQYDMFQERLNKQTPTKQEISHVSQGSHTSQFDVSTASSSRSELPQNTLANRLKNKGEMLALQKEEPTYVPSAMARSGMRKSGHTADPTHPQTSNLEVRVQRDTTPIESKSGSKQFRITKNTEEPLVDMQPTIIKATYSKPFSKKPKMEADKTQQPVYLEQIEPIDNVDGALRSILTDLKYDEWSRQFDALNILRRLIKFNADQLRRQPAFQQIIMEVIKMTDNLRSGIAKNAIITLSELSETYRRDLDIGLDVAFQRLIKKSQDTNQFISEEVRRVMISLFVNCTQLKSMSMAAQVYQSKNIPVKVNLCHCFNALLQRGVESLANQEKLITYLCLYSCDQAQEVRQVAKEGLLALDMQRSQLDQIILRVAPDNDSRRIVAMLDKGYDQTGMDFKKFGATSNSRMNKTPEARTPDIRNRTPNETLKGTGMRFNQKVPQELEQMPEYLTTAETAKDWKQRMEALDWLIALVKKHSIPLSGYKHTNKLLDTFAKLINDANNKVALKSCEEFIGLVEPLKLSIQTNATIVWNGVFQAMASNSTQLRQTAEQLFLELGTHMETQYTLPQITHLIMFGPMKSKGQAITMLSEFVPSFYEDKPQLVVKHILPLAKKLADEQKPEIKLASQRLFSQLMNTCPDDVAHLKLMK